MSISAFRFNATIMLLSICFFCTAAVQAKTTGKMDVKPGIYKLKSGSKLPTKGPVVRIYTEGASTKYSHVGDTHKTRPVLVKYTASCSNKGKLSGGDVSIGDEKVGIGSGGFSSKSVWVNVPYSMIAKIKPVKRCNEHAKTLSLQQDKPLEKIVQKGFVMKIPNVLKAKGVAFCTAAGLGKGDVAGDTTGGLGVFLDCAGNPKARAPRGTTGTGKPKPKDPGKTSQIFKSAKLLTKMPSYIGKCPVGMKYTGSIRVTGKGKVEYQIIGDGGYKTPVKTMQFAKAGSKVFQWTRMVRQADHGKTLVMQGRTSDPKLIKGWMQLKVIYKVRNNFASAKKYWKSKRQNFSVQCGTATPSRVRILSNKPENR
ncbi:MAG: hypothetical protein RPR28_09090 [Cycloclasticus sp.]